LAFPRARDKGLALVQSFKPEPFRYGPRDDDEMGRDLMLLEEHALHEQCQADTQGENGTGGCLEFVLFLVVDVAKVYLIAPPWGLRWA